MNLLAFLIIILSAASLWFTRRRLQVNTFIGLRPIQGYQLVSQQVGRAVESGRRLHFAVGRGEIVGEATAASVAALAVLDNLAEESCASDTPPIVSIGAATMLPLAQDNLRHAYARAGRFADYDKEAATFIAPTTEGLVYGGGSATAIDQGHIGSSLLLGRFGPELALMAEAAGRQGTEQIIGSDDPTALAVAFPSTENLIIGEELLAAQAYLEKQPIQLASLQTQDILRLAAAGIILVAMIFQAIT